MTLQLKAKHYKDAPWLGMHCCPVYNAAKEILGDSIGVNTCQIVTGDSVYTFSKEKSVHAGYCEKDYNDDMKLAIKDGFGETVIAKINVPGLFTKAK